MIIFPEGSRSPDGRLQPLRSGGFHLAIEAGVPIIPVTVSGSFDLIPKRSLKVRSGRIRVVYGAPIATTAFEVAERDALRALVRNAIEAGYDRALQHGLVDGGRRASVPGSLG